MATTFRIKRFSTNLKTKLFDEIENAQNILKKLEAKGIGPGHPRYDAVAENLKNRKAIGNPKSAGLLKRAGKWIKANPKTSIAVGAGTALGGMAIAGGVRGYRNSKNQKTFSVPRQKIFFFASDGTSFTLADAESATGLKGKAAVTAHKTGQAAKNAGNQAASTVTSNVNRANAAQYRQAAKAGDIRKLCNLQATAAKTGDAVKGAAETAYKQGMQHAAAANAATTRNAVNSAVKGVGIKQGAMNTWKGLGKMGKAGVIGGAALGAGLLAKGVFGGKKNNQQ